MNRFEDLVPLGPEDEPLLAELREVLVRHGALERFGITLLHRHFDLVEGERLAETVDLSSRTITIRPERIRIEAADSPVATAWTFTADNPAPVERLVCWPVRDTKGNIVGHML